MTLAGRKEAGGRLVSVRHFFADRPRSGAGLECSIVRREAGSVVLVLGRVQSDKSARIHYCLTVCHRQASSEAVLAEIGDVYVAANTPTEFGHTRFRLHEAMDLDAQLIVTLADGDEIGCDIVGTTL